MSQEDIQDGARVRARGMTNDALPPTTRATRQARPLRALARAGSAARAQPSLPRIYRGSGSLLFPTIPYYSLLFPAIPCYSLLFPAIPYYSLLFPTIPYYFLFFPTIPYYSHLFPTIPYSSLLFLAISYDSEIFSTGYVKLTDRCAQNVTGGPTKRGARSRARHDP